MNDDFFSKNQCNEAHLSAEIAQLTTAQLLDTTEHSKGFNFLHAAACYGLDSLLLAILNKTNGGGLQSQDKRGRTPIHHLAGNGRTYVLNSILTTYAAQIDLQKVNYKGRSALHSAAKLLQQKTAACLIAHGANPNVLDAQGHTPLSLTYHRHFPGQDIAYRNAVIDCLLPITLYWRKQTVLQQALNDRHSTPAQQAILAAWCLGVKYAHDYHWIAGMQIPLNTGSGETLYIIKPLYQTDFSQFVMLEHPIGNILLCLSRTTTLQEMASLTKHIEPHYIDYFATKILPHLRAEKFSQIWGIELAGIEAQWCAGNLMSSHLVLVNSPGLPEMLIPRSSAPQDCHYFFSSKDVLHKWGQYLWLERANFYTEVPLHSTDTAKLTALQLALKNLRQHAVPHKLPMLCPAKCTRGQVYRAAVDAVPIPIDKGEQALELFDKTTLAIKHLSECGSHLHPPELIDFARYEYCAHGLSYLHAEHNRTLIKWWGKDTLLPIQHIVYHQGLYCYLLMHGRELVVHFQGTDPYDLNSVRRDLDRGSAGVKRMRQHYLPILHALAYKLSQEAALDNVRLVICGHSLGGADAQNFFAGLLATCASLQLRCSLSPSSTWQKFIARQKDKGSLAALGKIKEIHLYAYNAAGIRQTTAELAKVAASHIKGVVITVNHQHVHQDIVNIVGETTLHDFEPQTVNVRSLFFKGHEQLLTRIKTAHTDRQFFAENIGEYDLHQGLEGQSHIRAQLTTAAPKVEPDLPLYHQAKRMLQTGNISECITPNSPELAEESVVHVIARTSS
jgi:hypothetical protein